MQGSGKGPDCGRHTFQCLVDSSLSCRCTAPECGCCLLQLSFHVCILASCCSGSAVLSSISPRSSVAQSLAGRGGLTLQFRHHPSHIDTAALACQLCSHAFRLAQLLRSQGDVQLSQQLPLLPRALQQHGGALPGGCAAPGGLDSCDR
jgi:hypothetical protein